jgi:predicted nucleic acid-binding protein
MKRMNAERIFLDTNVLVYAYSDTDEDKRRKSREIMLFNNCLISTQTVSEFCSVCIKKLHYPIADVRSKIAKILAACRLFVLDDETIQHALTIKERYDFSYYDCQIVAAAIECQCAYLFTEDLQDGQIIDGVLKVVNPFLGDSNFTH